MRHLPTRLAFAVLPFSAAPQDWPQFRGPGGLAVADDTPIPTAFGPDAQVAWKTKVPAGHSSPCIVGERIYLTGFEDGKDVVLALDKKDGHVLWSKRFEGDAPTTYVHADAAPVMPTPVGDAERVVGYFPNYGLAALAPDGTLLWEKRLAQPRAPFGVGSSPILFEDLLLLSRDSGREGGLLAMDVTDGSELLRIPRFQVGDSHGTPFLWRNADRDEWILAGGGRLTSYEPGTGAELWSLEGLTAYACTTPTADRDTLYFAAWSTPNASGRSLWDSLFERSLEISDEELADPSLLFKRLDGDGDGKIVRDELPECRAKDAFGFVDTDRSGDWSESELVAIGSTRSGPGENLMVAVGRGASGADAKDHVRWQWKRGLPYVASPLLYHGRVWIFASGGLVTALDAKTGEARIDRARLEDRAEYYMSPVGAAGHVLAGSAEGTLVLLAADADELVVEHTATFDEGLFATPAVLDGVVYLRTATTMWAFAAPR